MLQHSPLEDETTNSKKRKNSIHGVDDFEQHMLAARNDSNRDCYANIEGMNEINFCAETEANKKPV